MGGARGTCVGTFAGVCGVFEIRPLDPPKARLIELMRVGGRFGNEEERDYPESPQSRGQSTISWRLIADYPVTGIKTADDKR